MIKRSLKETKNGWFISGFTEAIYKENFEVGVKRYKAGEKEAKHVHKKFTEITVIISGMVKMNNEIYVQDDIIIISPGEGTDFEALQDTVTVCVKNGYCEFGDKYDDKI